ncbi:MAG: hypothetical protein ACI3ZQ_05845 [Candidatus Cryptobacteroides sp.]
MKIKGFYSSNIANAYIIETLDGKFYIFRMTPYREVRESELKPVYQGMPEKQVKHYLHSTFDFIPSLYGMEIE